MKTTKTEQHLHSTIKKILKNHFYQLKEVECYSDYRIGQIVYLIRFYDNVGMLAKRDLTLTEVLIRDTSHVSFDLVPITLTSSLHDTTFISLTGNSCRGVEGLTAHYQYDTDTVIDVDNLLSEYQWRVTQRHGRTISANFLDLRAFLKSYYVVKNVVKVNDMINERIMVEILNHHV